MHKIIIEKICILPKDDEKVRHLMSMGHGRGQTLSASIPALYTHMRKDPGFILAAQKLKAKHSSRRLTAVSSRYADHDTWQFPGEILKLSLTVSK